MDVKQQNDLRDRFDSYYEALRAAREMDDEGSAAAVAVEILETAQLLEGRPLILSGNPMEILKAVDALSLQGQLDTRGIDSPEVRRMLGLPLLEAPGVGDYNAAEKNYYSPIIFDLDGDGVETLSAGQGVYFDHAGDGFAESTGWVGADDGLLVWDRDGDGVINNGSELFGNNTILTSGEKAANGFLALDDIDTNSDGKIDAADTDYSSLRIWKDVNGGGYSAVDELFSLDQLGVNSIYTSYNNSSAIDANGNAHSQVGSFEWANGSLGTATDVWFDVDLSLSYATGSVAVSQEIELLPDIKAFGTVYDLHQAMVRDTSDTLKLLVEAFALEQSTDSRNALIEDIVFNWAGTSEVDMDGRGGNFDGRKLATLEQFYGREYSGTSGRNPTAAASSSLESAFTGVVDYTYAQLIINGVSVNN